MTDPPYQIVYLIGKWQVLLQEIVDEHVARIQSSLGVSYDVTFGNRSSAYFNAILVSKLVTGYRTSQ